MDKQLSLKFDLTVKSFETLNKTFAKARCLIAYAGKNRNGTLISKEVFDAALPSLKNCPVVCRYDGKTLGGHDVALKKDENGKPYLQDLTTPIGLVPESAIHEWIDVEEKDGTLRQYLATDILLWKTQAGFEYFEKHKESSQSMEIIPDDIISHIDEDGFAVVDKFCFKNLTAIGTVPCFESASIYMYAKNKNLSFEEQFAKLKEEVALIKTNYFQNTLSVEEKMDENLNTAPAEPTSDQAEVIRLKAELEALQKDFNDYKQDHSTSNAEVEKLRQFKAQQDEKEHKTAIDDVSAEFEDLGKNEEYQELLKTAYSFEDPKVFKEKCFAIRGKTVKPKCYTAQPRQNGAMSLETKFNKASDSTGRYGDIFCN